MKLAIRDNHRSGTVKAIVASTAALLAASVLLLPRSSRAAEERPILHLFAGSAKGEICVVDADGGDRRCLTNNRRFDYDATWSPDATRVAFVQQTNRPRNPDVYVMDASGSGKQRLTRSRFDDEGPQWSPDGTRIAWVRQRGDVTTGQIRVMNADGTDKRLLLGRQHDDVAPRWSPNGGQILFRSRDRCYSEDCLDYQYDIHVVGADGEGERNLTRTDEYEVQAEWSPDGSRIAFTREIGDYDAEIFVMDADGSDVVQITEAAGVSFLPRWSPDGSEIAFTEVTDLENFHTRLAVVTVETAETRILTDEEVGGVQPVWSPDGESIAFTGHRSLGTTASYEIHRIRPDGSDLMRVTRTRGDEAELDWGR